MKQQHQKVEVVFGIVIMAIASFCCYFKTNNKPKLKNKQTKTKVMYEYDEINVYHGNDQSTCIKFNKIIKKNLKMDQNIWKWHAGLSMGELILVL